MLCLFVTSCVPHRDLVNYQAGIPEAAVQPIGKRPEIIVQPNDVLRIDVFGPTDRIVAPFVNQSSKGTTVFDVDAIQLGGYLVSERGTIAFPQVGEIAVGGQSVLEVRNVLAGLLEPFMKTPVVNVRLLNFRVTVSGEVGQEGALNVLNERITVPEAIARAGGLGEYANRRNILLVRESGGTREYVRLDLTSADVFTSEYFYLRQNDLLYVEPLRAKSGAIRDQTSKTVPIITALATILAVIINLTQNR
ncbi:hypothetical protein LEM8419_00817 [Neolewinella maritima]|uniref:Polysaccharide export protein n=2 Tax=Neolewinella maritima TaxID=1383882 RepID=A0ABN8F5K9_9BACT|nr:hypothetical protein LEM8419_00817 [Neolewinella maritima]